MTQEEKELLIKDLSSRLPYGVKIRVEYPFLEEKDWGPENLYGLDLRKEVHAGTSVRIEEFKPYLRPMISMTEEEKRELEHISEEYFGKALDKQLQESLSSNIQESLSSNINEGEVLEYIASSVIVDWLNAHHFDYRGLIEKELAIDATELNIY